MLVAQVLYGGSAVSCAYQWSVSRLPGFESYSGTLPRIKALSLNSNHQECGQVGQLTPHPALQTLTNWQLSFASGEHFLERAVSRDCQPSASRRIQRTGRCSTEWQRCNGHLAAEGPGGSIRLAGRRVWRGAAP